MKWILGPLALIVAMCDFGIVYADAGLKMRFVTGQRYLQMPQPRDRYEYVRGMTDAFRYLSQTRENYLGVSECYQSKEISFSTLTGRLISFIRNPHFYVETMKKGDLLTRPAVEGFALMNRYLCEEYLKDK